MNLTKEDYTNAWNTIDDSLKMNEIDFEIYVRKSIENFIRDIDMTNIENRKRVNDYLLHLSTLYLNMDLNGHLYLLGKKEKDLAQKGRLIVVEYLTKFREQGFNV